MTIRAINTDSLKFWVAVLPKLKRIYCSMFLLFEILLFLEILFYWRKMGSTCRRFTSKVAAILYSSHNSGGYLLNLLDLTHSIFQKSLLFTLTSLVFHIWDLRGMISATNYIYPAWISCNFCILLISLVPSVTALLSRESFENSLSTI